MLSERDCGEIGWLLFRERRSTRERRGVQTTKCIRYILTQAGSNTERGWDGMRESEASESVGEERETRSNGFSAVASNDDTEDIAERRRRRRRGRRG